MGEQQEKTEFFNILAFFLIFPIWAVQFEILLCGTHFQMYESKLSFPNQASSFKGLCSINFTQSTNIENVLLFAQVKGPC